MTLAELRDKFPQGCVVKHEKHGVGTVQSWDHGPTTEQNLLVVSKEGALVYWLAARCVRVVRATPTSYKDSTKAPMEQLLQFEKALPAVAELLQWAENEKGYKFRGFMSLTPNEIRNALMRHTFQTGLNNEGLDDESKKLHALHVLANALMYAELCLSK